MAIVLPIVTQYSGKGLNQAVGEINRAQGAFGKLSAAGKIAGASLAAGAGLIAGAGAAFAWDSLKRFSDLSETLNKTQVVFGDTAKEIQAFADTANVALGQTRQQALDAASTFGMFGQQAGLAGPQLASFSTSLTALASDMASLANTTPDEAIQALGAALRGESEPIRRYQVDVSDAALKAKAMEMNIYSGTGALTQQQKVLAAYQVILGSTKKYQGDFARTSDGLANQLRILTATASDLQVSFGEGLAMGLGDALSVTGDLSTAMEDLKVVARDLGRYIGEWAGDWIYLAQQVMKLKDAYDQAAKSDNLLVQGLVAIQDVLSKILNPVGALVDGLKQLTGDTEAAGQAAVNMAYDYAASAQAVAAAANTLGQAATYSGGTPTAGYGNDWSAKKIQELNHQKVLELGRLAAASDRAAKSTRSVGGATDKAAESLKQARWDKAAEAVNTWADKLDKAKTKLDDAKQALADYAQAARDWLTGGVSIADAYAQQLDDIAKRADLDKQIADAIAKGDSEGQAKLAAEKSALGVAKSWLDTFTKQIEDAKAAGAAIDKLLTTLNPADTLGNQRLLDQLKQLQPGEAAAVATELVDKGLGPEIAAKLSALDVWAGTTATTWAQTFFQPGVDAANTSYEAIKTTLEGKVTNLYNLGKKLGKAFADGYKSATANLPADVRLPNAVPQQLLGGPTPIVVNVTAGIGNPVAIAREVQAVLASSAARLGA